jgi:hypothetical protein
MTLARARVAAVLGDRERAMQLLRDAFTEGLEHGLHVHEDAADFDFLRNHEPYLRLLRPVG